MKLTKLGFIAALLVAVAFISQGCGGDEPEQNPNPGVYSGAACPAGFIQTAAGCQPSQADPNCQWDPSLGGCGIGTPGSTYNPGGCPQGYIAQPVTVIDLFTGRAVGTMTYCFYVMNSPYPGWYFGGTGWSSVYPTTIYRRF